MEKVLIIVNPSSGDEKGSELAQSLEKIYKRKKIETKIYETTGQDNFKKLIQQTIKDGFKDVVLFGGDGTVSNLVNGITELEKRPSILLIPTGTTNNFGRMISSNKTKEEFLEAIQNGDLTEKKVDVGCVNDQYFISSIAVGLLPAVGWETDDELKAKIGSLAYVIEGIKALTEEEPETFNLQIDNGHEKQNYQELILFIVGLSNSIMGIETFFENAAADDGKLYYFGLKKDGLMKEASVLIKQVFKNTENKADAPDFMGTLKKASLHSDSEFNFLIDGDKGQTFPIELDILPEHLTFVVPK